MNPYRKLLLICIGGSLCLLNGCGAEVEEEEPWNNVIEAPPRVEVQPIDWDSITASSELDAMGELIRLSRYMTKRHRCAKTSHVVRIKADGSVSDENGYVTEVSLEDWKGIITFIRANVASCPGAIPFLSPSHDSHGDGFGELSKCEYMINDVSDFAIKFRGFGSRP